MNETKICLPAHAKINLSLDVLGRREDGYHEVCMVMQSIALHDDVMLEILEESAFSQQPGGKAPEGEKEACRILLSCSDPSVPADGRNLAWKAAKLLMEEMHETRGLRIHLEKRIPAAAGLAGGSSDAAAVMTGVNALFGYGLRREELMERAVKIGADVPFCILGGTALAEGIGEKLTALPPAPFCYAVLAKPAIEVSTKEVYQSLDSLESVRHPDTAGQVNAIKAGDFRKMAECTGNVLEEVTVHMHPGILDIIRKMESLGADVSRMSGSGPTVFGLFREESTAQDAAKALKAWDDQLQVYCTQFQAE